MHSRRRMAAATCSLLVAGGVLAAPAARATPAGFDPSFGDGGVAITDFRGASDGGWAVAEQGDGRLVVAGETDEFLEVPPFGRKHFGLARYGRDGALDTTFGANGKVITDFGGEGSLAQAVAIQPDGKIVVAGENWVTLDAGRHPFDSDFALARYEADGTPDPTFGVGGRVTTGFGTSPSSHDRALAVGIQADGNIVLAGQAETGDGITMGLVRYAPDGTPDPAFGGDGRVTTSFGGIGAGARDLAIGPDGTIVVAGSTAESGASADVALARYRTDGTLDATFGGDGRVTTRFAGGRSGASDVAIRADGRIVAAGFTDGQLTGQLSPVEFSLARYRADGTLDPAFGDGGKVGTGMQGLAGSMALGGGGEIVAAVTGPTPTSAGLELARFTPDGVVATFRGRKERAFIDLGLTPQFVQDALIQRDGRIVLAGFTANCVCNVDPIDFELIRMKAHGWRYDLPEHCINGSGIDFNVVFRVPEAFACGVPLSTRERWRTLTDWVVGPEYFAAPDGYVPAAETPLEDFVSKLSAVKVIVDGGTRRERTFTATPAEALRTDVTLDRLFGDALPDLPVAATIPSLAPLKAGDHTVQVVWTLSAMHCDGLGASEADNCLGPGDVAFPVRPVTFARPRP